MLTNYGLPEPWTPEQVRMFVSKALEAVNNEESHIYHRAKRVWAQKPFGPRRSVSPAPADETATEAETGGEQTEDDGAEGHGEDAGESTGLKKKKKRKRTKKKKAAEEQAMEAT